MLKLIARQIAAMSKDELWAIPDGPLQVEFDDGVLDTNGRATIFSAYMWQYYNHYPLVKTRMTHHLNKVGLGKRQMVGKDTHLQIIANVMHDVFDDYRGRLDVRELWRLGYRITNNLYNDLTYNLEEYVETLSALDFLEVIDYPVIAKANATVQPTEESIKRTLNTIESAVKNDLKLVHNPIASACASGLASTGQVLQCIGPRGFVTDIDSNIFRYPILRGYAHGLRTLYDSMAESRSAAKSLYFTKDPLQQSEYFNRKLQLLTNTLEHLHRTDCGSTEYLRLRVKGRDLTHFEGAYYYTPDGLKMLKSSDTHLIGEVVYFRNVLHCAHPDPRGVCSVCFGDLSLSVPVGTNIGHVSSTAMCEKVSQRVLSVKHEDASSTVDSVELSDYERRFIKMAPGENVILMADRLIGKPLTLVIQALEAAHLSDVNQIENLQDITLSRISELSEVQFQTVTRKGPDVGDIVVAMDRRKSSMSHQMLDYIKRKGWTLTPQGNYAIDMADWDPTHPLFVLPLRHINMVDFMKRIEAVIRSTGDNGKRIVKGQKTLRDFNNVDDALMELYALVTSKLSINIAHLAIIVKASQIRSARNLDYRIPLIGNAVEFGTYTDNMAHRSLGSQFAFQNHQRQISNVRSYIVTDRPDNPMDAFLVDRSQP